MQLAEPIAPDALKVALDRLPDTPEAIAAVLREGGCTGHAWLTDDDSLHWYLMGVVRPTPSAAFVYCDRAEVEWTGLATHQREPLPPAVCEFVRRLDAGEFPFLEEPRYAPRRAPPAP